jgi:hypothetical protein
MQTVPKLIKSDDAGIDEGSFKGRLACPFSGGKATDQINLPSYEGRRPDDLRDNFTHKLLSTVCTEPAEVKRIRKKSPMKSFDDVVSGYDAAPADSKRPVTPLKRKGDCSAWGGGVVHEGEK